MTVSGWPIEKTEINSHTLSELVRLYLEDRAEEDMDPVSWDLVMCSSIALYKIPIKNYTYYF